MNVSLPADLKKWMDREVRAGGFGTASEYLRDLLRRARERQQRHTLDATLVAAVEGGATTAMDAADWTAIRRDARTKALGSRKKR